MNLQKIIESVPNFSEGRDKKKINTIIKELKKAKIKLLSLESNKHHNRTIVSFIGIPKEVKKANFLLAKKCIELIDLNKHKGEHPRIGAIDVIPLIPITAKMEDCIKISKELAKEIWEKLKVPVYLYEESAIKKERKNLANIRKGQFEELREEVKWNKERKPDFGKNELHRTAGAVVIGARSPLIAFNVNLKSKNLQLAKEIARKIREKDNGLKCVKAIGINLKDKVQISMNLTNYKITNMQVVFEEIKKLLPKNVKIEESEIVGLVPLSAIVDCAKHYLKLKNFKEEQILEKNISPLPFPSSLLSN